MNLAKLIFNNGETTFTPVFFNDEITDELLDLGVVEKLSSGHWRGIRDTDAGEESRVFTSEERAILYVERGY